MQTVPFKKWPINTAGKFHERRIVAERDVCRLQYISKLRLAVFTFGVWAVLACPAERSAIGTWLDGDARANRSITLPDHVDLTGLVLLTADTLKLPLEYDPNLLKASAAQANATSVTIRGAGELTPDDLWALTNQVLAARGLALVRSPGAKVISLVKLSDAPAAAGMAMQAGETDGEAPLRSGFVHSVVRPKYRSAKELTEVIKPFLTKGAGNAAALGDSGLLVISDLVPRVEEARRLLEQVDTERENITPVTIESKNVAASSLVAAVMQFAAKRDAISGDKLKGDVVAAPDGRALLLLAPADSVAAWRNLIATLDQREEVWTREYTPHVFGAKEVAGLIEQTIRERGNGGAPNGAAAGGPAASNDDRFRVVIDDLTGTLIVTATPTQHERIAALVQRLDTTPQSAARPMRAFPIRNRPVKEVMETLQALATGGVFDGGASADSSSSSGSQSTIVEAGAQRTARPDAPSDGSVTPMVVPAPTTTYSNRRSDTDSPRQPASRLGRAGGSNGSLIPGLWLTADAGTNTLIAIAEPRLLAQLELLIKQLDVRQPQVMLEVFLVSLSEQDAMSLGVELEKLGEFGGNLYQLSSLFGLRGGTSGNGTPTASQGFTGAILNPGDFSALIKALETISNGSTRSLPRVLVNNNQPAVFNSVLQQPYTISNTTSGAGTTTSFGGTQDAGTTISVRPQIAEADHLVLEYSLSLSSFVGAPPANGLPPPRQQNNVSSNATIPDGHTVVVGGIELVSDGRNTSQVPYIGDVPLLGELFKTRDNSKSRQRFYVFIRAAVLRDQQLNDLKYLTDAAIRANGLQQVGVTDGFPQMHVRLVR
ncbi:MAG: secretin N-terminal domain-containing protein [Phycisphaerales bacterium]